MHASTFDTLAAARALKAAGMETASAEAVAAQLRIAADADRGELATKADLRGEFAAQRADFYRALWIQGGAIVAIHGGFIAIAASLDIL